MPSSAVVAPALPVSAESDVLLIPGEEGRLADGLTRAVEWLTDVATVRDGQPVGERGKQMPFKDWNGAILGEYRVATAKWGSGEEGADRVYEKAMADLQTYRQQVVEPEMLANVGIIEFLEEGNNGWQHDFRAPVDRSVLRGESPVVDPFFETGVFSGKSEVGGGWYVIGASADFVVTHEDNSAAEPAEGDYVLQVVVQLRSEPGEFRLAQKIPVEASAESRRFEVSLMVKTDAGFEGRLLVTGTGKGVYVGGTDGQWREVVTEAEVPPDAKHLYLAVYMNEGTGTIQLDDVLCVAR
jgi:hypothetical protein